ncbi:MAG: DNA adenine methylase, partial [Burkholderiales bacterium]
MYSNKLYSPLRYPGGKARFAPFVAELLRLNRLDGGHYLEPYAGGAGVALELLFHDHVSDVHINDADPALYDFWWAVKNCPGEMIDLVMSQQVSMDAWHYWRSVMLGETAARQVERGFATLYMNRTNRSGILKGGVIGGQKQEGDYLLDARFNKEVIAGRIERIANFADRIHIYCEDALNLVSRCRQFLPSRALIYLDPPYYYKGQGLYRNYYEHEDHQRIASCLQQAKFPRPWVVSYDNVREVREMYLYAKSMRYSLHY